MAARGASQHAGAPSDHPAYIAHTNEHPQALRVDENRRSDFGERSSILSSDFRLRTLAAVL